MSEYVYVIVARDDADAKALVVAGWDELFIKHSPEFLSDKLDDTIKMYGPRNVRIGKIEIAGGWAESLFDESITSGTVVREGEVTQKITKCAECPMKYRGMRETWCHHPGLDNPRDVSDKLGSRPDWCPMNHATVRLESG